MNPDSPGWQTVDSTGTSSAALPEPPTPGELLIFASAASPDDREWAGETVAEIAREWAGSVERLLLMDLDLQGPGIHHAVDAEPAEGATDVLLFGASISRVTQPVEDGRFHFAPSGTPVADPRVILSNNRWERVLQGCRDAGISLVVHLPLGQPGTETLLSRADRIVQLGQPAGEDEGIPPELADRVVAALVPPGAPGESAVEIGDLAPDQPVVEIEELAPEEPDEPVVDIGDLAPDGPVGEAGEAVEAAAEEAVSESRGRAPGPGPIVDIADLAPDEPVGIARPPEEGVGVPEDHAGIEDEPADFPEEPSPEAEVDEHVVPFGPETGDVEETAPVEPAQGLEGLTGEVGLEGDEEVAAEVPVRGEDEAVAEARESLEGAVEEAASEARREAPGPGPVVDIADLAPNEPVGIDRPAEEGIGIPEDHLGVEGEAADFPEEPSPEAEADEQVVPFGPETGEVEDVAVEPGGGEEVPSETGAEGTEGGFGEDEFAAGLNAIDAAAANKPRGFEGFDLEGLEELADPTGRRGEDEALGGEGMETLEGFEEGPGEEVAAEGDLDESAEAEEADWGPGPEEGSDFEPGGTDEVGEVEATGAGTEEGVVPGDTEDVEDATDFGGFSGELDLVEHEGPAEAEPSGTAEEAGPDEVFTPGESFAPDDDLDADEDFAADREFAPDQDVVPDEEFAPDEGFGPADFEDELAAPDTGAEPGGGDLGDDLVTGPDFGQGAPEDDEPWDDEPTEEGATRGTGGDVGGAAGAAEGARRPEERAGRGAQGGERRPGDGERGAGGATGEGPEGVGGPVLVGADGARDRTRGRPLRLLVLALILAVGAVSAHWFGVVDVPGLDRVLATVLGPAGTGVAPTVDTGAPQPTSPVQGQSLLIDVYRDAQSAADVALALQDRLPDRIFAVAPVQQDGDVIYRLLAGPANTPDQASGLRETLAQVLTREDPSGWTPQATSLAFVIDELPALDGARARAQAATGDGVFGYVLQVSYPDGRAAYRVYAGGYSSPEEARALQGILSQAGIPDATFTQRRGEVPE